MDENDVAFIERARRARQVLSEQFLYQPGVSLIDIGFDPQDHGDSPRLALRVHIRRFVDPGMLGLPAEIDGIPVRVVVGDYHLE